MKILFLLQYPGYLRYFDSTLRGLLARGHRIDLFFEQTSKQPEGLEALQGLDERLVVHDVNFPMRRDVWKTFAHALRASTDFVRYLDPAFTSTPHLRDRAGAELPGPARHLARLPQLPAPIVRACQRAFHLLERTVPADPEISALIASIDPDVVLVSPLVTLASWQTDTIKAAKALGRPTGLLVGSWDHLTSKGSIRVTPDRVFLWNHIQKDEATRLHRVDPATVIVTGAQPFDKWFDRQPTISRGDFCRKIGLPPDKPYLLFVGSTATISHPDVELEFVKRWVSTLRRSGNAELEAIPILIRPHPFNSDHWTDVRFDDLPNISVYPRGPANPVNDADRDDYFHSLFFSTAIIGINTSAMVEATILAKPVLTVLSEAFTGTQKGTLHFRYLLPDNGGFLEVASNLEEHVAQLRRILENPEAQMRRLADFVQSFVRPDGRSVNATARLVEAIEQLGTLARRPEAAVPLWLRPASRLIEAGLAARSPHRGSGSPRKTVRRRS